MNIPIAVRESLRSSSWVLAGLATALIVNPGCAATGTRHSMSIDPAAAGPSAPDTPMSRDPSTKPDARLNPFGFTPPARDAFVTQALVPWVNRRTGQRFVAPTGGWTPPNDDWQVEDRAAPPLRR